MNQTEKVSTNLKRWLFYAPGIGLGHFTRSFALARVAARHGDDVELLASSPHLPNLKFDKDEVRCVWRPDPAHLACHLETILSQDPQNAILVVDTFPHGIIGELTFLERKTNVFKVFVGRKVKENVVTKRWNDSKHIYDGILLPGEGEQVSSGRFVARTHNWLVRSSNELLSRAAARKMLGVEDDLPLVLFVVAGHPTEFEQLERCYERCVKLYGSLAHMRLLSPNAKFRHWPAFDFYRGCDLIVGQGGYNTLAECSAVGVPLFVVSRTREFDDQNDRVIRYKTQGYTEVVDVQLQGLSDAIGDWIENFDYDQSVFLSQPNTFDNGAETAYSLVCKWKLNSGEEDPVE